MSSLAGLFLMGGLFGLLFLKSNQTKDPQYQREINKGLSNFYDQMGRPMDWFKTSKIFAPREWIRGIQEMGTRGEVIVGSLVSPLTKALGETHQSPPKRQQPQGHVEQGLKKQKVEKELFEVPKVLKFGMHKFKEIETFSHEQSTVRRARPGLYNYGAVIREYMQEAKQ